MTFTQHRIETVLKEKVRDNYRLFLYVNERIEQVGNEVSEVKRLIQNTQQLFKVRFFSNRKIY